MCLYSLFGVGLISVKQFWSSYKRKGWQVWWYVKLRKIKKQLKQFFTIYMINILICHLRQTSQQKLNGTLWSENLIWTEILKNETLKFRGFSLKYIWSIFYKLFYFCFKLFWFFNSWAGEFSTRKIVVI